ncbi:endoplasmic reticulum-Golgi intermediate compartment protein 2 isoform X2 [Thrips palmi]|uniref:Endoplasmic reticulum-Golgi intermediate compartment protein 2 isoform X2 n=1 Tax=Thrips palmi TaxID=161013 RepID=A0A6P8ZJ48_THRPL|nr:endoplasmic reticulum-Golgi intermediate compartment protein 2 isoform X2 [Thrips palmi]
MLRQRIRKVVSLKTVRELDAFPKVPESYVEASPIGGTVSVFCWLAIIWLVYSETKYWLDTKFLFKFTPDTDFDAKLKINIDLTVATPCNYIGADIVDSTNQNIFKFGNLEQEDTWWELNREQRTHFDTMRSLNSYLREEFHALQILLWKSGQAAMFGTLPARKDKPKWPTDACRIYGSLTLNKVSGNFHVSAGKPLALPVGHVHLTPFVAERAMNFSHRIHKFSFGDPSPGIIHPMEGDEKITDKSSMLYQYFIQVVPTDVDTFFSKMQTYQYSVKDHDRPIDHRNGSHGVAGLFFKYDMSALKVHVIQERDSIGQFLTRLSSMICGLYVCSGFLNNLVLYVIGLFTGTKSISLSSAGPSPPPSLAPKVQNNVLMSASVVTDVPVSLPLRSSDQNS